MSWKIQTYNELTTEELYKIIQLRVNVFVVEQQTCYEDLDNHDQNSIHISYVKNGELFAYARLLPPGEKFDMTSIGRVITKQDVRGTGLGKEMIQLAINTIEKEWPGSEIFIQAQEYLKDFYGSFGFKQVSEPYIYDSLPHLDMLYKAEK
ncbi:GNAT family N-acetyltransferase [Lysinibacillus parviboronicapiens]|uniref:GNAT family N-acetyltransferase n=1 Tax=Lysinibacillus parviboronicapiens TaxID=436516 RepID=UPI0006D1E580|nr:GNAT family N-acetyltransferase [Lysinibacillus parviboronicapiens]